MADDAHRPERTWTCSARARSGARSLPRTKLCLRIRRVSRYSYFSKRSGPAKRLVFVLHDMFAVLFDQVASIVGRSLSATRQLASRTGRRACKDVSKVPDANLASQPEVVDAFVTAARGGRKPSFSRGWSGSPGRCL